MEATQYIDDVKLQIAEHLCNATGMDPTDRKIGRFICNSLCEDNLEATMRWLEEHLDESGALLEEIRLDKIESAFRSALFTRVPNRLLGGNE